MKAVKNIMLFLPVILCVGGFILMIPGSFISGNTAFDVAKGSQPAFGYDLSNVKGDLDDNVRKLWITFGMVGASLGLACAILTIFFPLTFGKAVLLDCIIIAFVGIAFNAFILLALLFFIAGGILAILQKRE